MGQGKLVVVTLKPADQLRPSLSFHLTEFCMTVLLLAEAVELLMAEQREPDVR